MFSVFEYDGKKWNEKINISDIEDAERINKMDISGSNLIVAVYDKVTIYNLDNFSIPEFNKVTATNGSTDDYLGYSTSIWQTRAVVGAYRDKDHGYDSGSAYIYERDGLNWVQIDKLTASDANSTDRFGISVDNDEDLVVVGAPLDDDKGTDSGSAYIFKYGSYKFEDTYNYYWKEYTKLTASDATSKDRFGYAVAISTPLTTKDADIPYREEGFVVVGAPYADGRFTNTCAIYVINLNDYYYQNLKQIKLVPDDTRTGDKFGWSVAIDGRRIVAASSHDDDNGSDSGSIYVFDFDGSTWKQTAKLKPADGMKGDRFGISVAVHGNRIIAGANLKDADDAGAAYIFELKSGQWQQTAKLTAFDAAARDRFGSSVSIWGNKTVVGVPYADHSQGINAGAAYVYEFKNGQWALERKIVGDAHTGDYLGKAVDIFGNYIIAGAHLDDDKGKDAGSAYIFDLLSKADNSLARWENEAYEKAMMAEEEETLSSDNQSGMGPYPNPFESQFTINFKEPMSGKVTIELVNQLGVVVYQKNHMLTDTHHSLPIDLSTIADKGLLFLRVISENQPVQLNKILRQ